MKLLKPIYKIARSIVISLILLAIVVYVGLYVLLSLPSVQKEVKNVACQELSALLGGQLDIKSLSVSPFSEVLLKDVSLSSPDGVRCAEIRKVAAGIDLWSLISEQRIVLNYAEIISLNANLSQEIENGPLNIQFLIDALSPKDKTKPPTRFDLKFRNIVIRDSKANFSRPWMPEYNDTSSSFANISLTNLRLDLSIPTLKNNLFKFDIRNLQCEVNPGVYLRGLSANICFNKGDGKTSSEILSVRNLRMDLPHSSISVGDIAYDIAKKNPIDAVVKGYLTPADMHQLLPSLASLDSPWTIDIDAYLSQDSISLNTFRLENDADNSYLTIRGNAWGLSSKDSLNMDLLELKGRISENVSASILKIIPDADRKVSKIVRNLGMISIDLKGNMIESNRVKASGLIETGIGSLKFNGMANSIMSRHPHITIEADANDISLGDMLDVKQLGPASFSVSADIEGLNKNAEGNIELNVDYATLNGRRFNDLIGSLRKLDKDIHADLNVNDTDLQLNMEADYHIEGEKSTFDAFLDMSGVNTYLLGLKGKFEDCLMGFDLDIHTEGDNADNITGFLSVTNFDLLNLNGKSLHLDNLSVNIDPIYDGTDSEAPNTRSLRLRSDWIDANFLGKIYPSTIASEIKQMLSNVFPSLIVTDNNISSDLTALNDFNFDIEIKGIQDVYEYLGTPVTPLTEIPISGFFDGTSGKFELSMATPHLRQGKNKLMRDTSLAVSLDSFLGMAKVDAATIFPAKKGDVQLALNLSGAYDKIDANVLINPSMESSLKGSLAFESSFARIPNPFTNEEDLSVHVDFIPSAVAMKETVWNISNGHIDYAGKNISVRNFTVEHGNQFVKIDGIASEKPEDYLTVKLNDIDLDYIFSILNINYVTFGGMATGEVVGSRLLTKSPMANTKFLRVKNLSYNGAVLGDGNLAATYFPHQQEIGIYAVINDPLTRERRASIDGGIWVTRDSLSFSFDANKVNLQIMKPFVSAFCSDLKGLGSGKCKLYGTFSDIDLVGNLRADTISMKLDFTNTWYHAGNDSVFMGKGLIEVNPLTLYDSEGHTAELSGWLRHRYFHEPVFNFKIRDAKSILCYDTNEKLNPLWYGTIYGTGNAQIAGRPGLVEIEMNMETEEKSKFFYVISDADDTGGYSFLTFTDRRKEEREVEKQDSLPVYLHEFMKKNTAIEEGSSNVILSLKGTVTNDVDVTLIMDPIAGDKITARGQGALQMDYNMASNDLRMIGTYTLSEGKYYFTLQDIIIKNFIIKPGSSIKFNGDPMDANLDIAATYRVNASLTDLDESFARDKEINRTNVPVDAILLVEGPMTHPDIDFDIELPTLTSDVERKVKSIVSTNDMMSRQIIYLLALNRFYTPEYTKAASGEAKELSSMASSTLSSQLSNILSNMTDKLAVAPSFRSDNGDFTDMEFDLALSSRLLNNRLLVNGNFGYRDAQTSNTQFIGDFDIEYLLNRTGNLRLKAYNHFNDQSYYLRSALTTQGVGVVYRKDFDRLFNFRKRKKEKQVDSLRGDSVANRGDSVINRE